MRCGNCGSRIFTPKQENLPLDFRGFLPVDQFSDTSINQYFNVGEFPWLIEQELERIKE
jgi:hypothetical protein